MDGELHLLLVADDPSVRSEAAASLARAAGRVALRSVADPADLEDALGRGPYDVVVADLAWWGGSGADVLRTARGREAAGATVLLMEDAPAGGGRSPDPDVDHVVVRGPGWTSRLASVVLPGSGPPEAAPALSAPPPGADPRTFFDTTPLPAFIARADGPLVACNPAFARLLGHEDRSVALRQPLRRILPDAVRRDALLEDLRAHRTCGPVELAFRCADGTGLRLATHVAGAYGRTGELTALLGSVIGAVDPQGAPERARRGRRLEALGRLAGGVAHDLNNLLTAINGYAALVAREAEGPGAAAAAEQILASGGRAAVLVRQLLQFGRRDAFRPELLSLGRVVEDARSLLRHLARDDVELVVQPGPDPALVLADAAQLEQVVVTLVLDAGEAQPDGGRVTVSTGTVESVPNVASTGPHALLCVTAEAGGAEDPGLAGAMEDVREIVHGAGGHVRVEEGDGGGPSVRVYLPLRQRAAAGAPPPDVTSRRGITLLLVEDDDDVRRLLADVLARRGHTILQAADADEARRAVKRHGGPLDLLLSDVVLPGMSGPELATLLARDLPGLKVLFMSGHGPDAITHCGFRPGPGQLLRKPFTPSELLQRIDAALGRSSDAAVRS